MKIIDTLINFEDSRGKIIDLVEKRNINAITFISFNKEAVRANHYHKKTTQWNYLLKGKVRLVTQFGDGPIEEFTLGPGDLVLTAPMEKHALVGLEDSELLVFTEGPRGGEEYESDTFRLETQLV
ncbi:MAG: cupin domain-containing protein [Methylophilaceae bacterium]|nr:MAG: cupin domain-containing protein [Methylophilaceae bacterium]